MEESANVAAQTIRRAPSGLLACYVREIVIVERGCDPSERLILPAAEMDLLFRIGTSTGMGTVHVVGTPTRAKRKRASGDSVSIAVRIRPGAAHRFFPGIARELADRHVSLATVWGGKAQDLLESVANEPTHEMRFDRIETALTRCLRTDPSARDGIVTRAIALLDRPAASVSTVADELGLSSRSLHRHFVDHVGLSPKAYGRIARFRRAMAALPSTETSNWAMIAADAGYYDQSHMIADFRSLVGNSPSGFRREIEMEI